MRKDRLSIIVELLRQRSLGQKRDSDFAKLAIIKLPKSAWVSTKPKDCESHQYGGIHSIRQTVRYRCT
jgi:hypothetical protein